MKRFKDFKRNNINCSCSEYNGIDAYWVWIPRFAYKIEDATNSTAKDQAMTASSGALEEVATDSHMMKNSEWGAVAILSQSKYGIYNPTSLTGTTADGFRVWTNPRSLIPLA